MLLLLVILLSNLRTYIMEDKLSQVARYIVAIVGIIILALLGLTIIVSLGEHEHTDSVLSIITYIIKIVAGFGTLIIAVISLMVVVYLFIKKKEKFNK